MADLLADVRGIGLLAGIDIRSDGAAASRALTRSLLDLLIAHGVLVGSTGPRGDVLKVRPPLVWKPAHVDVFIYRLHRALSELRAAGR